MSVWRLIVGCSISLALAVAAGALFALVMPEPPGLLVIACGVLGATPAVLLSLPELERRRSRRRGHSRRAAR